MLTDSDIKQSLANRTRMWIDFSRATVDHIEGYAVSQYGDYPTDQLTEWTLDDLKTALKKYANRMGNNQRGDLDQLLDMMKIAHYASVAWHKMSDTEKNYAE